MKNTQRKFVETQLRLHGGISRNACLKEFITRLAAIICDMQKHGYTFSKRTVRTTTRWGKGLDYIYEVTSKPKDEIY